jgi:hypothetical protein
MAGMVGRIAAATGSLTWAILTTLRVPRSTREQEGISSRRTITLRCTISSRMGTTKEGCRSEELQRISRPQLTAEGQRLQYRYQHSHHHHKILVHGLKIGVLCCLFWAEIVEL